MENLLSYYRGYLPFVVNGKFTEDSIKKVKEKLEIFQTGLFTEYKWRKVTQQQKTINKHLKQIADYFLTFENSEELWDALQDWKNLENTKINYNFVPVTKEKDNSIWRTSRNRTYGNSNRNKIRIPRKTASKRTWQNFKNLFPKKFESLSEQYKPKYEF